MGLFGFGKKKKDDLGMGDLGLPPEDKSMGADPFKDNSFNPSAENNPPLDAPPSDSSLGLSENSSSQSSPFNSSSSFQQSALPQNNSSSQTSMQSEYSPSLRRDIELVLAKLDAVKAELDSVNQRVQTIERSLKDDNQKPEKKSYWQS